MKAATPRTCPNCGEPVPPSRRADAAYCSLACAEAARNTTGKASRRIAARRSDGTVLPVTRADLYERDGWTCQLCGLPVNRAARFPDPDAPSLDHIVPLARGGSHEVDNLRTTHLRCNVTRRDRMDGDEVPALLMEGRRWLTIPEVADALGVGYAAVDRWARAGLIPVQRFRAGGTRYVLADDVDDLRETDPARFDRRRRPR